MAFAVLARIQAVSYLRFQNTEIGRLHDIGIGCPGNLVIFDIGIRSVDYDWRVYPARTNLPQCLYAIHHRHPDIKDDEINIVLIELMEGFVAVSGVDYSVSLFFKLLNTQAGLKCIILNEEQSFHSTLKKESSARTGVCRAVFRCHASIFSSKPAALDPIRAKGVYFVSTFIFLAFLASVFSSVTVSNPSLYSALTFSGFTSCPREIVREKAPKVRSL